jgi:1-acyl-sn-glycerol-3-phosphate acyltransferase
MDLLVAALEPLRQITRPTVDGIDRVPADGALLVGNHTVYGLLDVPFLLAELWRRRRIAVRGLGEHAHYRIPGWRDLLESGGMVRGTRANTAELMRRGEHVLVFPGGAREVNKRKDERYRLIWKQRLGFAKLAIAHGYPIVPFAAVGAEEMLDVVVDDDNPVYGRLTKAVEDLTGIPLPPVVRGIGPTPLPRPQRLSFWFGEPIATTRYAGREDDVGAARAVRDKVRHAVEGGIEALRADR